VALAARGIANWIKTDATLHVPTYCSNLADAALVAGDVAQAERALTTGIQLARENGDAFALAELERLNGRVLLLRGQTREARENFMTAMATAERQGARLYRLRAARDAAEVLIRDGDRRGAVELLAPVVLDYAEHREGLDFSEAAAVLAG
jgi:predicted ATPase